MTGSEPADRARNWLLDLVHAHRLSPTQRRVVQYMLDSAPSVAFASTVEIAEAAGVSQPTVTRIATALGFAGYAEFRSAIRGVVLSESSADSKIVSSTVEPGVLAAERQALVALEATIGSERMRRAIELLGETQPLGIIGLRASSALANYLGYFANKVLPDVHVLDDAGSVNDSVLQLHLNGATAVLAFLMPRYPAATVDALATARTLGMKTVAIIDTPLVAFADVIDIALVAPVSPELVFDSHSAAIALSISLLNSLADVNPRRTRSRLEAHEALLTDWAFGG